jgi:hypothetical protein
VRAPLRAGPAAQHAAADRRLLHFRLIRQPERPTVLFFGGQRKHVF